MLTAAVMSLMLMTQIPDGTWEASLASPGGELAFVLEFGSEAGRLQAFVVNGPERVESPRVSFRGDRLVIGFDHYDSEIRATVEGDVMSGGWTKRGRRGSTTFMAFEARRVRVREGTAREREGELAARHLVRFESSEDPAVLLIGYEETDDPWRRTRVHATFMTTTGDYRFLAGDLVDGVLTLSVFDGAHAFLFRAVRQEGGGFVGDFWSRDTWHETWVSTPDADAQLSDAFAQTTWDDDVTLESLVFKNLNGEPTSVASLRAPGQPMVLKVFGSWCPNCHDAGAYLSALAARHPDVAFVGLAFEHTDDFEVSARQVRRYAARHDIAFALLVAGLSDKDLASAAIPALDRVRSFPTTIFIDGEGRVRGVHTGFSGPATGAAYDELRAEFERRIEEIGG